MPKVFDIFQAQAYLENLILPHFPCPIHFAFSISKYSSLFVCILLSSCLWTTKWVASHLMMCQKIATWRHEKCCYPLICYKPHSLPSSSSLESPLMLSNDDFSSGSLFLLWSFMINDFFYVYSLVRTSNHLLKNFLYADDLVQNIKICHLRLVIREKMKIKWKQSIKNYYKCLFNF